MIAPPLLFAINYVVRVRAEEQMIATLTTRPVAVVQNIEPWGDGLPIL
jgi:hypothetical protein